METESRKQTNVGRNRTRTVQDRNRCPVLTSFPTLRPMSVVRPVAPTPRWAELLERQLRSLPRSAVLLHVAVAFSALLAGLLFGLRSPAPPPPPTEDKSQLVMAILLSQLPWLVLLWVGVLAPPWKRKPPVDSQAVMTEHRGTTNQAMMTEHLGMVNQAMMTEQW